MAAHRHTNHQEGKSFNALKSAVSAARSKRTALVSLHPNLQSLNPMARLTRSRSDSAYTDLVEPGTKRKRSANAAARAGLKRRKADSPVSIIHTVAEKDEEEASESHNDEESEPEDGESDADDCKTTNLALRSIIS